MENMKIPFLVGSSMNDVLRDEVKSVLQYIGPENVNKNLNHAVLSICGRFLLGDRQLDVISVKRKALQTLSILLRVINAIKAEGSASYRVDSTVTKCTVTLALSELKECSVQPEGSISLLCDILRQSLSLMDCSEKDEWLSLLTCECEKALAVEVFGEVSSESSVIRPDASLRILELILESIESLSLRKCNDLEEDLKSPIEDQSPFSNGSNIKLHQIFVQLVLGQNDGLRAYLLVVLVPLVVRVERSTLLLRELWDSLCGLDDDDTGTISLGTVCALADLYLPEDGMDQRAKCFPLVDRPKFWRLIQNGVCAQLPLVRKQALYLLKRAIDGLVKNGKQINLTEFEWNVRKSNLLQAAWEELFIVLEALEETQTHLVKPVLTILARLLNEHVTSTCHIHLPWLLCAFQRVLFHPSQTISKWGIETLLGPLGSSVLSENEANTFSRFILNLLLPTLNSSTFFGTEECVSKLLTDFFCCASKQDIAKSFFSKLLFKVTAVSWGQVPLFYIIDSLSHVPFTPCWDKRDLKELQKLVTVTLATQSIPIRGGLQSRILTCMIKLTDTKLVSLDGICDLLSKFHREECFRRGTESWLGVVRWLCKYIDSNDALRWIGNVRLCGDKSEKVLARSIVLLLDARKVDNLDLLKPVLDSISDCETRLYANQDNQNACIKLLAHLIEESEPLLRSSEEDNTRDIVLDFLKPALNNCILLARIRLQSSTDIAFFNLYSDLLSSFEIMLLDPTTLPLIPVANLQQLLLLSFDVIKSSKDRSPTQRFFAVSMIKILSFIPDCSYADLLRSTIDEIVNVLLEMGQLGEPVISHRESKLPQEMLDLQGHLVSDYSQAVWELLASVPDVLRGWGEPKESLFLDGVEHTLEFGGRTVLAPLLHSLRHLLCQISIILRGRAQQLIESCWKAVLDLRRTDLFWPTLDAFVSALMQPSLVLEDGWCLPFAIQCGHKLFDLSDSVSGVANLVAVSLSDLAETSLQSVIQSPLRELLLKAIVFGPIHRKDQKAINGVYEYISALGDMCSANLLIVFGDRSDSAVRAAAILILARVSFGTESWRQEASYQLVLDLLEMDKTNKLRRVRYFGDSEIHRLKNRILQGLLLLEPSFDEKTRKLLVNWSKERIIKENHQPSVRYMTEWLLVRLLCTLPNELSNLWVLLSEAMKLRAGAACSVIGVTLHTVLMMEASSKFSLIEIESFVEAAMDALLPCTMAQHFNVRLHAQVTIMRIWSCVERLQLSRVLSVYQVVVKGIRHSLDQAGGAGHTRHLHDFYLHAFHPFHHFTLQTIFEELPRLSNVASDEWISVDQLIAASPKPRYSNFALRNTDDKLSGYKPSPWIQRPCEDPEAKELELAEGVMLQKKMIPWKWMNPVEDLTRFLPDASLESSFAQHISGDQKPSLYIVASLIDKAPNLGGLARTCEIMGASLVLPSLSCAQDREFRALSMSAEMWVPMCEVKPHQLPQFLAEMKNAGYKLIGVEQTTGSIPLNEATFPSHSLLLLGNEREGVPANLLPLLDQCVEIPQFGLVRSLNVHVTGALCMWEYACQHFFNTGDLDNQSKGPT